MKLYKVTSPEYHWEDCKVNKATVWRGTASDARKARIAFEVPFKDIKPAKRPRVEVEEVDVPTNKVGLLVWLNENAV